MVTLLTNAFKPPCLRQHLASFFSSFGIVNRNKTYPELLASNNIAIGNQGKLASSLREGGANVGIAGVGKVRGDVVETGTGGGC